MLRFPSSEDKVSDTPSDLPESKIPESVGDFFFYLTLTIFLIFVLPLNPSLRFVEKETMPSLEA